MQKIILMYGVFCALSLFVACENEPIVQPLTAKDLVGKWSIASAKRDSTDTEMLKEYSFLFDEKQLETTLPINETDSLYKTTYALKNNEIVCADAKTKFKIGMHSKDSMILQTKLFEHQFVMQCVRQ